MDLLMFIIKYIKENDYISICTIDDVNVCLDQYTGYDFIQSLKDYHNYHVVSVYIQFNVINKQSNYFIKISKDM